MLRHPFSQVTLAACLAVVVVMGGAFLLGADSALASTLGLIASSTAIVLALSWTERDALRRPRLRSTGRRASGRSSR